MTSKLDLKLLFRIMFELRNDNLHYPPPWTEDTEFCLIRKKLIIHHTCAFSCKTAKMQGRALQLQWLPVTLTNHYDSTATSCLVCQSTSTKLTDTWIKDECLSQLLSLHCGMISSGMLAAQWKIVHDYHWYQITETTNPQLAKLK